MPTGLPSPGCRAARRTYLLWLALQGSSHRGALRWTAALPLRVSVRVVAAAPHHSVPSRPDPPESTPQTQGLPTLRDSHGARDIRSHSLQGSFSQEVMSPGPESAGQQTQPQTGSRMRAASRDCTAVTTTSWGPSAMSRTLLWHRLSPGALFFWPDAIFEKHKSEAGQGGPWWGRLHNLTTTTIWSSPSQ